MNAMEGPSRENASVGPEGPPHEQPGGHNEDGEQDEDGDGEPEGQYL